MNLTGKAIMMVMAMVIMKTMTKMLMKDIMMAMTMMVVMLLITDFYLKEKEKIQVCVFYNIQIIRMSDLQLFQRKILMELIINLL